MNFQVTAFAAAATWRGSFQAGLWGQQARSSCLWASPLPPQVCTVCSAKLVITYPSISELPKRHWQFFRLLCFCLFSPSLVDLFFLIIWQDFRKESRKSIVQPIRLNRSQVSSSTSSLHYTLPEWTLIHQDKCEKGSKHMNLSNLFSICPHLTTFGPSGVSQLLVNLSFSATSFSSFWYIQDCSGGMSWY